MKYARVARIVNTFGIRGDIKVIAETDFAEERFQPGSELIVLNKNHVEAHVEVEQSRLNKGTYIIHLKGYDRIEEVEPFKNKWLAIESDDREELDDHEFYHVDIIGLTVKTTDGETIGTIKDIIVLGPNDVWVVKRQEAGKDDALIPYIEDVVKEVNLNDEEVIIELMEGLIDDAN
ncbi:ribosome maturation factor RimM [Dolosicoccus paucivorans]|uniref:ribosome maturation factor RimM n=1 Tax=Dolosicoccus paucivorans TaxID=84521 RepID=UPI000C8019D1|nr:ribosome maturation factor RimM [Dolosicoccus paucivorans]PMB84295.1 ribosome maturation factor RimM [Dolosicoccus paucivorans]